MNRLHRVVTYLVLASLIALPALLPSAARGAGPANAHDSETLTVVSADAGGIELNLELPWYTVGYSTTTSGVECRHILTANDAQMGEPGHPQLPVEVGLVGIPPGVEVSVTATPLESEEASSDFFPCPAPQPTVEEDEDGMVRYVERSTAPDASIYSTDALYPAAIARIGDIGFLRSQRIARLEVSPFQVNPATGRLVHYRRIQIQVHFDESTSAESEFDGDTQDRLTEAVDEPAFYEETLHSSLLNYEDARTWRQSVQERSVLDPASGEGWLPPQSAYRIRTGLEGMYAVTGEALADAGLPLQQIDPRTIQVFYQGEEIAIQVDGGADDTLDMADRVLFYAEAYDEIYTGENVYWLTYGQNQGRRMQERAGTVSASAQDVSHYRATQTREENRHYVSSLPMEQDHDHWYGSRLTARTDAPGSQTLTFSLNDLASSPFTATLQVGIGGHVNGPHQMQLSVNESPIYTDTWRGRSYHIADVDFDSSLLQEGENTVQVQMVTAATGQFLDMAYLDYVSLDVERRLAAEPEGLPGQLLFSGPGEGDWSFSLAGFQEEPVTVFDVTDPVEVSLVGSDQSEDTVQFGDSPAQIPRYVALTSELFHTPLEIQAAPEAPDLLSSQNRADYIIVAPQEFVDALLPLVRLRRNQGYQVTVADLQTIYDQFNYGRPSAEAIRSFLAYAYHDWQKPAPSHVLFAGDGNYDPRGYLDDSVRSYIPPYLAMVDPELGETAADNRYVAVAGDDLLPDMNLGRFPARSVTEVESMVQKTIGYEMAAVEEEWNRNVLFVADNMEGGGGSFYNFSDAIADGTVNSERGQVSLLPDTYQRTKVYLDKTCSEDGSSESCRQQIVDNLNSGSLFVSYVGHGTKSYWAKEKLLSLDLFSQLDNADRLPIMLPMTCLEGYYHDPQPGTESLAEAIVRLPERGSVASWSPTGLGLASGHDYLETGLMEAIFHHDVIELGAATTAGKLNLLANAPMGKYDDLLDTFVLFGDPALRVRVVDSQPTGYHLYLPHTEAP